MRWTLREVDTRHGVARAHIAVPRSARAQLPTLVLGHGAGGGVDSADLQGLAGQMLRAGGRVVLVEQPWRVAGRRVAPRPSVLDEAWLDAVVGLQLPGPVALGGRSAGARVACRTAARLGAVAVVALAFPLHPPGRPERSRAEELVSCPVPVLVVQGTRDPFGSDVEVRMACPGAVVLGVPGGDHGLARVDLRPVWPAVAAFLAPGRE